MATILINSQAETRSKIEQDIPKLLAWLRDSSSTVRESALNALGGLLQHRG
jgi:hypothetical protein